MSRGQLHGPSSRAVPTEGVRADRPDNETWRADALTGSRHSRWLDELRLPQETPDIGRAQEVCGRVARLALQDLAPALLLLPSLHRRRLQALTAYTLTLFDFARQSGLEGERLAAVNRWEFDLDTSLEGPPTGQPIFLQIHALQRKSVWSREGFDLLHAAARHRCVQRRPPTRGTAEREAGRLGKSLAWILLAEEPNDRIGRFAAALVRLRGLLDLGDDLRRHQARLPIEELPDVWSPEVGVDLRAVESVVLAECDRLCQLTDPAVAAELPKDFQAAARYSQHAARRLIKQVRTLGVRLLETPPHLNLRHRLSALARSRWF